MPRRERGQILLIAVHIHYRVGGHILWIAAGKHVLALWGVRRWKFIGRDLEAVSNLAALRCVDARIDAEWRRSSQEIVLPDVRRNHGDSSTGVHPELARRIPVDLNARPPTIPSALVARLRIDQVHLPHARGWECIQKARCPVRSLGDGCVDLIAKAVVESPVLVDFPGVLYVRIHVVSVDRRRTNVRPTGKVGRRDADCIAIGIADEETAQRVRQRISGLYIVLATRRGDERWRIHGASAEVVLPVWTGAKISGVAVEPSLDAPLDRMPLRCPRQVQLA